jgi:hypothetical protein
MTLRCWLPSLVALAVTASPLVGFAQLEQIEEVVDRAAVPLPSAPAAPPTVGRPSATKPDDKKPENEPEVEPVRKPKVELPPRHMVLRLQDGSTITGELSVNEISIDTEFGELTVPVAKIKSFTPGLESNTKAAEELKAKLKDLESDDYKTREQAHKDLAAMGPKIAKQLSPHLTSENAEVKRHVTEILKEFEQLAEEMEDDEEEDGQDTEAWIKEDTLETSNFTVIGKISPKKFEVASKYGPLTIALGDIIEASRPVETRDSIRRSMSVPGQNLAARSFKSTGIRVQAGDRISITASGTIVMSPWGSNAASGPDGMPNYGWYVPNSIPGGALVYKIGDKGQITKAGTKTSFVAKSSGVLQLAIGMMPEYSNEGYNFPGEYKVKLKVEPQ